MNVPGTFQERSRKNMNIRHIVKNGRGSYYINIPKEMIKELKWKERQKVEVDNKGNTVIITDWKK